MAVKNELPEPYVMRVEQVTKVPSFRILRISVKEIRRVGLWE